MFKCSKCSVHWLKSSKRTETAPPTSKLYAIYFLLFASLLQWINPGMYRNVFVVVGIYTLNGNGFSISVVYSTHVLRSWGFIRLKNWPYSMSALTHEHTMIRIHWLCCIAKWIMKLRTTYADPILNGHDGVSILYFRTMRIYIYVVS